MKTDSANTKCRLFLIVVTVLSACFPCSSPVEAYCLRDSCDELTDGQNQFYASVSGQWSCSGDPGCYAGTHDLWATVWTEYSCILVLAAIGPTETNKAFSYVRFDGTYTYIG